MSKQPFFLDHEHHPPFAFFPGISEFRVPGLSSSTKDQSGPCQCPPPRSTAGVPPPPLASLPGRSRHLLPGSAHADALSPTWFRLRAATSWAYKFLSDRPSPSWRFVTPRRGDPDDRGPRVCGRRGGLGSGWPRHNPRWRCLRGGPGVVIKTMMMMSSDVTFFES